VMLGCMFGLTIVAVEMSKETTMSDQLMVTTAGAPVQVESAQMVVAPNGELLMRPEPGADGDARLLGVKKHGIKVGGQTWIVRAARGRKLQEGEPEALEGDSWEVEVSAEDAEGLLEQLEVAPDTQVFLDLGEDEDSEGRRLQASRRSRYFWQLQGVTGRYRGGSNGARALSTRMDGDETLLTGLSQMRRSGRFGRSLAANRVQGKSLVAYRVSLVRSVGRYLSGSDEEAVESESRKLAQGTYRLVFAREHATAGALTRTLRLGSGERGARRLEENSDGSWEVDVSAEDAEGLLAQLEGAPDTQVFLDLGEDEDEDSEGRRLQGGARSRARLRNVVVHAGRGVSAARMLSGAVGGGKFGRVLLEGECFAIRAFRGRFGRLLAARRTERASQAHWKVQLRSGWGSRALSGTVEEGRELGNSGYRMVFTPELKVTGGLTWRMRLNAASARRLQEGEPEALEGDSWEVDVSAEDAEGLLEQLEVAPDTQVFLDFEEGADGEDEDDWSSSRRLARLARTWGGQARWQIESRAGRGRHWRRALQGRGGQTLVSGSARMMQRERAGRSLAADDGDGSSSGKYRVYLRRNAQYRQLSWADGEMSESESRELAQGEYSMVFVREYGRTRTLRLHRSERRLEEDGESSEEDWDAEFEVSAEDAEGLLAQLEVAPDTQVFLDFGDSEGEDEDAEGRRLAGRSATGKVRADVDGWEAWRMSRRASRRLDSNERKEWAFGTAMFRRQGRKLSEGRELGAVRSRSSWSLYHVKTTRELSDERMLRRVGRWQVKFRYISGISSDY